MKQIPIMRSIERVPGGLMVVPMLIGATIVTFAPGTSKFFGSFVVPLVTAWWAGCVGSSSADGSSAERSAAAPTRREPH